MWKINKSQDNHKVLEKFDASVLVPLRNALDEIDFDKAKSKLPNFQLYEKKLRYEKDEETSIMAEMEKWYEKKHKKLLLQKKYEKLCKDISGNVVPEKHSLPAEIKIIFSKLVYLLIFDKDALAELDIFDFSRDDYISNIMNSSDLHVCPYCDATTILKLEHVHVEHYFSRSSYPLLSANINNLLICCLTCNKEKLNTLPKNHHSPLLTQHGDDMSFDLDGQIIKISSSKKETTEFIELVKLQKTYEKNYKVITLMACGNVIELIKSPELLDREKKREPYFFLKSFVVKKAKDIPMLQSNLTSPY